MRKAPTETVVFRVAKDLFNLHASRVDLVELFRAEVVTRCGQKPGGLRASSVVESNTTGGTLRDPQFFLNNSSQFALIGLNGHAKNLVTRD